MFSPSSLTGFLGSARGAGPRTTLPSLMEYWLPWHGHWMMPLLIVWTVQPRWVQVDEKPSNSPAVGWVTTMPLSAVRITPPPIGTFEAGVMTCSLVPPPTPPVAVGL